ncbi:MAG: hypothetical protein AB3N21_20600 [Ruegeria sp.]|uniref:hypothetical protein n=1 Tax=Ruegeria sp. TaxID=1879320 RepID=UPI00349EFBEB
MIRLALISPLALAACAEQPDAEETREPPEYLGAEAVSLDDDLVQMDVSVSGTDQGEDVVAYAQCAVAQYALDNGFGYARHLRTNVNEKGGVWTADAVYTISPAQPQGLKIIDARVEVETCAENGIPTV